MDYKTTGYDGIRLSEYNCEITLPTPTAEERKLMFERYV